MTDAKQVNTSGCDSGESFRRYINSIGVSHLTWTELEKFLDGLDHDHNLLYVLDEFTDDCYQLQKAGVHPSVINGLLKYISTRFSDISFGGIGIGGVGS